MQYETEFEGMPDFNAKKAIQMFNKDVESSEVQSKLFDAAMAHCTNVSVDIFTSTGRHTNGTQKIQRVHAEKLGRAAYSLMSINMSPDVKRYVTNAEGICFANHLIRLADEMDVLIYAAEALECDDYKESVKEQQESFFANPSSV